MAEYGDLNYTTAEINTDLAKVHDKKAVVEEAPKDDNQYARKNGAWAVIEASGGSSTQYLDLSIFSEESGTLSDEDYQKVVKAYEDGVNIAGDVEMRFPVMILDSGEEINITGGSTSSLLGGGSTYIASILIVVTKTNKSYVMFSNEINIISANNGTKALTDNGQYAEFASPTKVVSGGSGTVTKQLSPNTLYEFGECTSLTITLASEISGIRNEYMFEFVSGSTATTLSIPQSVGWMGGEAPTIEANKTYQCSIVNNIAVIGGK